MGTEKRTSNRINENASSKVTGRENWRQMVAVFCKEYGYTLYVAFCDTGLEYPEIRIFAEANAKRIAEKYGINMVFVRLRPDMNFRDVLIEYGYPVISKEI